MRATITDLSRKLPRHLTRKLPRPRHLQQFRRYPEQRERLRPEKRERTRRILPNETQDPAEHTFNKLDQYLSRVRQQE